MPSTKVAWEGAWVDWQPGQVAVAQNGVWVVPPSIAVKPEDGTEWQDTGYEAYPNPPTSFAINSWSYTSLSVKWAAPTSGGAPVSTYEIQLRNSTNTSTLASKTDATSPSANFTVTKDTKYYVRIRSKAASGLTSDWVYIKPSIGHPEVISQRWVRKSKSYLKSGYWIFYKDYVGGIDPQPRYNSSTGINNLGVYCTQADVTYNISSWTSSLTSPSRNAYFRRNTDEGVKFTTLTGAYYSGDWDGNVYRKVINFGNDWSGGTNWGLYLTGSGWATSNSGTQVVGATIRLFGTEYYQVQEDYVSTAEKANTYW